MSLQTYFSFYDKSSEIEGYTHLDYLKEYSVEDLQDIEFCKSVLMDLVFDQDLVLGGGYPDHDIANEIQLSIDYLLRLHRILKTWLNLKKVQLELIGSIRK